jgi:hypothetical protein
MSKINTALRTLGLPPLIVEDAGEPEPMSKKFAAGYVAAFAAVYAIGFIVLTLMTLSHRF